MGFSKEWADESSEDAEAKSFWDAFFNVFGITRRRNPIMTSAETNKVGDKYSRPIITLIYFVTENMVWIAENPFVISALGQESCFGKRFVCARKINFAMNNFPALIRLLKVRDLQIGQIGSSQYQINRHLLGPLIRTRSRVVEIVSKAQVSEDIATAVLVDCPYCKNTWA